MINIPHQALNKYSSNYRQQSKMSDVVTSNLLVGVQNANSRGDFASAPQAAYSVEIFLKKLAIWFLCVYNNVIKGD